MWKYDNQKFKEATFIQTGMRDGVTELGQSRVEKMCCGTEKWWQGTRWSHIPVRSIKIVRDILGVSDPSPRPDCTTQGPSTEKINPHYLWL